MHPEKVICQKLLQVSNIDEDKLQFWTFLPITFSLQFWNQRHFDAYIQILLCKRF